MPDYEQIKKDNKKLKTSSSPTNTRISNNIKSLSNDKIDNKDKNKILNTNYKVSSPNKTINKYLLYQSKNNKNNNNLISQPTMRYKPRTDLERVYDVLNGYNYDAKSRDIIERQLKSINLYDYKKPGESIHNSDKKEKEEYSKSTRTLISKSQRNPKRKKKFDLYKTNKIYYNPKNDEYKPWQRREDLNTEAYGLLSSYHYKTHFKAAEEIAESNYKYDKNNKNKTSVFLLPNLLPKCYKPKPIKTDNDSEEKEDPFKFGEDDYSSEQSEDYEEFDKNYNPIIQKTKTISDPEKMKILTKIAFKQKKSGYDNFDYKTDEEDDKNIISKSKNKKGNKNFTEDNNVIIKNKLYFKNDEDEDKNIISKSKNKKGNKNFTEDNNVVIKNKLFFKNTQFDKISSEILELCNVYSTKSKFNNTVHKSKGGKTMITQGMTVGEFEKKYGLQEK